MTFSKQALYSSITLPSSIDMKYRSKILLFCLCVVLQTSCSSQAVYTGESFAIDSPFKVKVDVDVATACESARRSLLGQGYLIESSNSDGVKARKAYRSEDDQNTFIEMTIVCLPETNGSTLFATGVLSGYALKKSTSSASVGLSALGSISLPIGQSADSLVKVSEETINDKEFYQRFFAAVDNILGEMRAGTAASQPEAVVVAPEPGPAEAAPVTVTAPEPIQAAPGPTAPTTTAPATTAEPVPAPVTPLPQTAPLQTVPTTVSAPAPAAVDTVAPVTPAPPETAPVQALPTSAAEPVPAPVAPMVAVPETVPLQSAPTTVSEPAPEQVAPTPVPAPVTDQAAPVSGEPLLRQRQEAPVVTPEQVPVAAPSGVPATAPAPVPSTPAIVAVPAEPAPMERAPEPAMRKQLKPITVQKARWPVNAPVVLPEPEPAAAQEAPTPMPTPAPEQLPPMDPFR